MLLPILLFLSTIFSPIVSAASPPSSTFVFTGDANTNLTVSLNVPSDNTQDDLYFHMAAPSGQSWIAFGFGTEMANSLMFVAYKSENGENMTVSPRLGIHHDLPRYTSDVQVNVLDGTRVDHTAGTYYVDAKCTNCRKWGSHGVDVQSTSQPMIYAVGPDTTLQSDSLSAPFQQHAVFGKFALDMVAATGVGGVPTDTQRATGTQHVSDNNQSNSISKAVHALFMLGAFVIVFPAGYLALRGLERVWMHALLQSIAAFGVILGLGSGIYLSIKYNHNPHLTSAHQLFGIVIVFAVLVQWTLGMVHHRLFKAHGQPTMMGKIHRIAGPAIITLGIINGALGFNFAGENMHIIGYVIVVALVVIFVWTMMWLKQKRQRRKEALNSAAAQNFRMGAMEPQYAGATHYDAGTVFPAAESNVPLQPYSYGHSESQQQFQPPPYKAPHVSDYERV